MTTYLTCKKCGYGFALSTTDYMANGANCPRCGCGNGHKKSEKKQLDEFYKELEKITGDYPKSRACLIK